MTFKEFLKYCKPEIKLTSWQKEFINFLEFCNKQGKTPIVFRSRSHSLNCFNKLYNEWRTFRLSTIQNKGNG